LVESISSPSASDGLDQAIAYCADQVKQYDRDRYTICAGVSPEARKALYALYAFNLEVAKIRETVSEPMLGQIRLQWWREAIDGIYQGTPRDHAVVTALAAAIGRHNPPRERFERLIDAREFDLEDRQPDQVKDLVSYADATSGELSCLALHMLQVYEAKIFEKARLAGAAWALNGLLYAVPFHAAQGRCYLPRVLTEEHGVSVDNLNAGSGDSNLCRVVAELATLAQQYLGVAGHDRVGMAFHALPAFTGLSVVAADLRRLKKARYDVFSGRPTGPFRRRWLLIKDLRWGWVYSYV
jgi:NADH dehydrogenase [ubiquinone] 1 alpha subcomplex assembly factor 6